MGNVEKVRCMNMEAVSTEYQIFQTKEVIGRRAKREDRLYKTITFDGIPSLRAVTVGPYAKEPEQTDIKSTALDLLNLAPNFAVERSDIVSGLHDHAIVSLYLSNNMIGTLALAPCSKYDWSSCCVSYAFLRDEYQGSGFGWGLWQCTRIFLDSVNTGNVGFIQLAAADEDAQAFWQKCGFKCTGKSSKDMKFKDQMSFQTYDRTKTIIGTRKCIKKLAQNI